ncbi:hypothetical protein BDL97_14G048300 [Sphagnum fallax]|nr:hypothetical protein BDL97_14G048300 [Sphagnum fallax]KAH8941563.1 hypothetical protein BDL97_14G048300 [Sphagnum fallax]
MTADLREMNEKLQYFKDVTQVEDSALAEQILEAHGWDLGEAVATMVDKNVQGGGALSQTDAQGPVQGVAAAAAEEHASALGRDPGPATAGPSVYRTHNPERWNPTRFDYDRFVDEGMSYERLGEHRDALQVARNTGGPNHNPNMVWRMVTLPFSIIRGSYNLMYGAVGMGMWIAGGMLNYSLGALGFGGPEQRAGDGNMLLTVPAGTAEAAAFLRNFESEYGEYHPTFQVTSFMEALRRAGQQFKFLFVYLHSPEHANTPPFCERSLCNEHVVQFVNENFVAWGGDVRTSEGFQMSNSLKASTFPFCAVVMGSSNQRIALLQQVEGPRSAAELVSILQRVVEEQGVALVAARVEEEERQLNRRLREEQDAAYQAALQADQERERLRQEEAERVANEVAETERKRKEEEEAASRVAQEAAEREAALVRRRHEKAMALGKEPDKGPNVTQVLLRFPNGERKERRFMSDAKVRLLYDYVDSLGMFDGVDYHLLSNFPRTVYDQLDLTLKSAGLHPQASLFVHVDDK